jgi:hypothetical protein
MSKDGDDRKKTEEDKEMIVLRNKKKNEYKI